MASLPNTPAVSMAIGTKQCVEAKDAYFTLFLSSASLATHPASKDARPKYEGAKVSVHVKSHTKHFPFFQGARLIPSGRFPSERNTPDGSKREETLAEDRAWWMRSLMAA